jgi:hypothetical protein
MSKENSNKALVPVDDALEALRQMYPTEAAFNRILLPRLGMVSQDIMEGKGKNRTVVTEAGTFFVEKQSDEEDPETGKKLWEREELGTEIEGIIIYQRKQLRAYDEATETFTSSPVYDDEEEVIPLWANKAEVARGTPKELKAREEFAYERDGKVKSKLEDNRILYVLYEGEIYQLNLRGSSMYAFMTFARKLAPNVPPAFLTHFGSEPKEKGSIEWNQMTFETVKQLDKKELAEVMEKVNAIKEGIAAEKGFFASKEAAKSDKDEEEDEGEQPQHGGRRQLNSFNKRK